MSKGQIELGLSEIYVPRCIRVLLGLRQCVEHRCLRSIASLTFHPRMPGDHLPSRAILSIPWQSEVLADVITISCPLSLCRPFLPHKNVPHSNTGIHSAYELKVPPSFLGGYLLILANHECIS